MTGEKLDFLRSTPKETISENYTPRRKNANIMSDKFKAMFTIVGCTEVVPNTNSRLLSTWFSIDCYFSLLTLLPFLHKSSRTPTE